MFLKLFLIILISFLSFSCSNLSTNVPPDSRRDVTENEKKLAGSADKFGLKLFRKINSLEGDKNIFISPLSVSIALGMTLNGANGQTYDAMRSTLELSGLTQTEINNAYKSLSKYLTEADPKVTLNIANSIWHRDNFSFEETFANTNKEFFNATIAGLDFTNPNSIEVINNWVSSNTKGLIPAIIESIPTEMVMYLINAVYFKGTWKYEFKKEATAKDKFILSDGTDVVCDMMNQKNNFRYVQNDLFQAVQLPYGDDYFYMTIILPKQGENPNTIIQQLTDENWNAWNNGLIEQEGDLWLPKIKLQYKLKLNNALADLGMGIAFSDYADFTRINSNGGLFISEVLHKTYVKIDEEGTEAAAVTSVGVGTTSIGGGGFSMKVNRPYIIAISEKNSGSILFIGKIVKPE